MASGPPWGLPAGQGDLEEVWRALGSQFPTPPHFPCAYPALPCCGLLPTPPLGLLAAPLVSAPYELPGAALYWPLAPPVGPGVEEASRAKGASSAAAASRESTAALKAWLGRHRKNPYPTKGEKVLLALVSRMSLTQVSTWFANARRRLKKEHRAAAWSPAPRLDGSPEGAHEPGRARSPPPDGAPSSPQEPRKAAAAPAAKIWCLAELATGAPTPRDGSGAAALQH
ncbi:UNVERIFIED_CONTAM: hypothetical protein K2H54_073005 [Gekko kuhli]